MSSDETPKIEPTLKVADAPSIAPEAKPEAAEAAAPKIEAVQTEPPKVEPPKAEAKAEPEKIEVKPEQKLEPKIGPKAEAPTLPPAAQLAESAAIVRLKRRLEPKPEPIAKPSRNGRFALLAACVAIAASIGAIGGSLGVAKLGTMFSPAPPQVAVAKDLVADEVKALKDNVAQLRGAMKSLSDNLATLKVSVSTSNVSQNAQNAQIAKIAEVLDRVEKAQAEQRKMTTAAAAAPPAHPAPAAPETTGSIAQQKSGPAVPMVLGDPPTTLKPPILQDYVLRRVYDGAALIEGRNGIIEVEAGETAPGLGRIEAIKRQDGRWVVVTARGLIVQR